VLQVRSSVSWDHTVRAPLVAHALEVLRTLTGSAEADGGKLQRQQAQRVMALFPKLAQLMCYSHPLVQQALSMFVATRVGPLLEGVLV
jgi:hypothetical protein